MDFLNIDPIAFSIFGFAVHWYGLAYVAAFILGGKYVEFSFAKAPQNTNITKDDSEKIFTWVILAVLLGGRLGYVFFYNFNFYIENPLDILKLWQGGMSFHGGLLGVAISLYLYGYRNEISFLDLTDRMAPAFCIGLFLGRIANFINGELYGRVTDLPWGVVFPYAGPEPRHPSQLYEAFLEGGLLFIILHLTLRSAPKKGVVSGLFLIGYGLFRSLVELVRVRDNQLSEGVFEIISMGQILSLPMIAIGCILIFLNKGGR